MKNLTIAYRSLFKKGRGNLIKILSLGLGLAIGIILISKICFERSFDTFIPDYNRVYVLNENFSMGGKQQEFNQTPGAVASTMKAEIPAVELASRITILGGDKSMLTNSITKQRYMAENMLMVDSNYFDITGLRVLVGNPHQVLNQVKYIMISRKLAEKMGGVQKVVGQNIELDDFPGVSFPIGGVYETIPENSSIRCDIMISMVTMNPQSLQNWIGNDRYVSFVKLYPGHTVASVNKAIKAMMERHAPMDEVRKAGVELAFSLHPILESHSKSPEVKKMNNLLALIAFILLFAAVMNYILIVLSSMVGRTKEVAVQKCYGASGKNILGLAMSETFLHVVLSVILAILIILTFQSTYENLLEASLGSIFTLRTCSVLLAIVFLIFVVAALVPTYIYTHIPVAAAFRSFKASRRFWKLCLLFIQFVATAFLVALLLVISRQYNRLVNDNPGYSYKNLVYYETNGIGLAKSKTILEEIRKLPEVSSAALCDCLPYGGLSGNNVRFPGRNEELFNVADMYNIGDDFFKVMEIPVVQGRIFNVGEADSTGVMVSKSFADKICKLAGWKDGCVGKGVIITEHSSSPTYSFTICGVYKDFRIGSLDSPDTRPSVMFHGKAAGYLIVKMKQMSPDAISKVSACIHAVIPERDTNLTVYKTDMVTMYDSSKHFRDSIMIGGIVTLLISLIGLLGYTTDETNRRGREIAIRKVNGATVKDILQMIVKDISFIALPAIVIGVLIAVFVGEKWLSKFAEKASMGFLMFVGVAIAVYIIIMICVLWRAWHASNTNPADVIKSE